MIACFIICINYIEMSLDASGGPYPSSHSLPPVIATSVTVSTVELQTVASNVYLQSSSPSLPTTITSTIGLPTVTNSIGVELTARETKSLSPETVSKNIQSSRSFSKFARKHRFNVMKPATQSVSSYNGLKEHQPMTVEEVRLCVGI